MSKFVAPSVKALCDQFRLTEEQAKAIREEWKRYNVASYVKLKQIDKILNTYGTEYIGRHRVTACSIEYCNAGDSYAPTLFYCETRLFISTIADMVESRNVLTYNHFSGEYITYAERHKK